MKLPRRDTAVFCNTDCTCGRHTRVHRTPHTEETKNKISAARLGQPLSDSTKRAISKSLLQSYVTGERVAASGAGNKNFSGGETGDAFAALLCPLRYRRECWVEGYKLDFALLPAKVNIELDGPYHIPADPERDVHLRSLGWKVIRVRHT